MREGEKFEFKDGVDQGQVDRILGIVNGILSAVSIILTLIEIVKTMLIR